MIYIIKNLRESIEVNHEMLAKLDDLQANLAQHAFAAGIRVYAAHEDASRQISDAWIEERFAEEQAKGSLG